jgi:hypothetical protein
MSSQVGLPLGSNVSYTFYTLDELMNVRLSRDIEEHDRLAEIDKATSKAQ